MQTHKENISQALDPTLSLHFSQYPLEHNLDILTPFMLIKVQAQWKKEFKILNRKTRNNLGVDARVQLLVIVGQKYPPPSKGSKNKYSKGEEDLQAQSPFSSLPGTGTGTGRATASYR